MVAMDKNSPELWHQLSTESPRSYEAFKIYMFMSPAERSVAGAWREWTGNPEAARPSPFFEGWARDYAWSERARSHDHHLELIRERGMEEAIKEEARTLCHMHTLPGVHLAKMKTRKRCAMWGMCRSTLRAYSSF